MDEAPRRCSIHDQVVSRLHELDTVQNRLCYRVTQLEDTAAELSEWKRMHSEKSQWFYEAETDIRQLVDGSRWLTVTRKVIAWLGGAILAVLLFYHQVIDFIEKGVHPK